MQVAASIENAKFPIDIVLSINVDAVKPIGLRCWGEFLLACHSAARVSDFGINCSQRLDASMLAANLSKRLSLFRRRQRYVRRRLLVSPLQDNPSELGHCDENN